jgi:hypothetical protein
VSGNNFSNATAVGLGATAVSSNYIAIGNGSVLSIKGAVNFTTGSDGRIKNDIEPNVPGLQFITSLQPVTYHYNLREENELMGIKDNRNWPGKYDIEKITFSGFIAQDVDSVAKNIGYDFSGVDKIGPVWGLRYSDFIPSLVKAIQEVSQKDELSEKRVEVLERKVQELQKIIESYGK